MDISVKKTRKRKNKSGRQIKEWIKCSSRFTSVMFADYIPVFISPTRREVLYSGNMLCAENLGPVIHTHKDVPSAHNLMNYFVYSKVYPRDMDGNGDPTPDFFQKRIEGFLNYQASISKYDDVPDLPEYTLFTWPNGEHHRYTYVQAKYFFCKWYEFLARDQYDFKRLKSVIFTEKILLVGPYGHNVSNIYAMYLGEFPFMAEHTLYSMLTIDDPEQYPWNLYFNKFRSIYPDTLMVE